LSSLPAAVLWDLDGTLIDTEPYWIRCEKELVASFGGQWTDADAKSIVGSDLLAAAEIIRARGGVNLRPQEIVDHLVDGVIAQLRDNLPWRPGARELLASLRLRGVPCALVTMSWKRLTDEVLPHLPPGSFQAVITGDMVMNGAPMVTMTAISAPKDGAESGPSVRTRSLPRSLSSNAVPASRPQSFVARRPPTEFHRSEPTLLN